MSKFPVKEIENIQICLIFIGTNQDRNLSFNFEIAKRINEIIYIIATYHIWQVMQSATHCINGSYAVGGEISQ